MQIILPLAQPGKPIKVIGDLIRRVLMGWMGTKAWSELIQEGIREEEQDTLVW